MFHQFVFSKFSRALKAAALAVATLAAMPAQAEDFHTVDWFERPLGDGVVWRYYRFDHLFGVRQSVHYLDVDLGNPNVSVELPYLATTRGRPSVIIPGQFPASAAGVNGTYFNTAVGSGGHRTYLRVGGTVIPPTAGWSAWGLDSGIAITTAGAVSVIPMPGGGWSLATQPDIMACGPMLINSGTIDSAYLTSIGSHCTSRHPRTAAGVTADNRLILLVVDGRTDQASGVTCEETAIILDELGVVNGFNLDGGGSTTMWGRGQAFSGVVNYPSDNGAYDHNGERSCANGIAVIAPTTSALTLDGQLTNVTYSGTMLQGTSQTVSVTYKNIGTTNWTSANTRMVLSRPETRASALYTTGSWLTTTCPVTMAPATVAPGASATFTFVASAPVASSSVVYEEFFMLTYNGVRFGPANNETLVKVLVNPEVTGAGESVIVETRAGGQNVPWYSDSGMADTATNTSVTSATPGIGMRYGSTFLSVAGAKSGTWAPQLPAAGQYRVYVAWGAGSSRRNPITYHVTHTSGTDTFLVDQAAIANQWIQLGSQPFAFPAAGGAQVQMTNENVNVSGNMFAGPVRFEFVPPAGVEDWAAFGASPAAWREE